MNCCSVCLDEYNWGDRKPLLLRCGHSFCWSCLQEMKQSKKCLCPLCQVDWSNTALSDLQICYQLCENCVTRCKEHDEPEDMWCENCTTDACLYCIQAKHKGCIFHSVRGATKNLNTAFQMQKKMVREKCHINLAKVEVFQNSNKEHMCLIDKSIEYLPHLKTETIEYEASLRKINQTIMEVAQSLDNLSETTSMNSVKKNIELLNALDTKVNSTFPSQPTIHNNSPLDKLLQVMSSFLYNNIF